MTRSTQESARCLCGGVEVQVEHMSIHVGACQCEMCRKWGGGPYLSVECGRDVSFVGEELITVFNHLTGRREVFAPSVVHIFFIGSKRLRNT